MYNDIHIYVIVNNLCFQLQGQRVTSHDDLPANAYCTLHQGRMMTHRHSAGLLHTTSARTKIDKCVNWQHISLQLARKQQQKEIKHT